MTTVGDGIATAIPTLGALALGAQKLLPLMQQIYSGWAVVAGSHHVLGDVVTLLRQPVAADINIRIAPLAFNREINVNNVSFQYKPQLPMVVNQINLTITKGTRIGFIGSTGSGKSTLIDILMGLLTPSCGEIFVDGKQLMGMDQLAWQRNIAHVPQAIFLADASFAENIAFGVPINQIDQSRVRLAAQQAQISKFIESGSGGYEAMVGERGVRLSGGQRQRIGIARALYKNATVLVLDEATSALDSDTENSVMHAIRKLSPDLTILIIAHRLSTLSDCDKIYRLNQGRIESVSNYQDLQSSAAKNSLHIKDTFNAR